MTNAEAIPVDFRSYVSPEDEARANFYALLARLWYAGPDEPLLTAIAKADEIAAEGEQVALAQSWRELRAAAAIADAAEVAAEHEALFGGTGKAAVTPYVSHYLNAPIKMGTLVALRDELAELGLANVGSRNEPEDHFAALCEVMRRLIAAGSNDAALQRQRKFFTQYIGGAYNALVEQVFISERASFYKVVAHFTKAFLDVEAAAQEMLS
jgi:TorA maturation chaperone TorD